MTDKLDVKRYDRQIRLWGMDTQRGILGARILVLEFTGVCNEIVKNLVLAGVGHVCIQDAGFVTVADIEVGGVFSIGSSQVGMNRAEAAVQQLHPMNPQVDLTACTKRVDALAPEMLASYHFIIGADGVQSVRDLKEVDAKLEGSVVNDDKENPAKRPRRDGGNSDNAHRAGTLGMQGFCFLDLGSCTFLEEEKKTVVATDPEEDVSSAPVVSTDGDTKKVITKRVLYPSLSSATNVEWNSLTKRVPPFYCALQLLVDNPGMQVEQLLAAKQGRLKEEGLGVKFLAAPLDDAYIKQVAASAKAELSPICAVVGGVVAADVIKIISGKEPPINNAFFYDGATGEGVVQRLGPSFDAPWGKDCGVPKKVE